MKKFICVILFLIFLLSSCTYDKSNVRELISAMNAADINAPAGKIYLSDAVLGDDEYMSTSLRLAYLGKYGNELDTISSFAVRLSLSPSPYEYAVIEAKSVDDTAEIAKLLSARIDAAKALATKEQNEDHIRITSSAEIYIRGRFVFLLMTYDNESMLTAAKKLIS